MQHLVTRRTSLHGGAMYTCGCGYMWQTGPLADAMDSTPACPRHHLDGIALFALQLDNIHHEVQQMAQTIDQLHALVAQFNETLTADVAAATQAIADLKAEVASLKGAPPASVDFQPELDAANAQLAALEAATASAKS